MSQSTGTNTKDNISETFGKLAEELGSIPQINDLKVESDKLLDRFEPEDKGHFVIDGKNAFVTLTKMGGVIVTFAKQEDARNYFKSVTGKK